MSEIFSPQNCKDCHGTHDIHKKDTPQSKTYKLNSPRTCGNCHEKEYSEYTESIHGQKLRENIWDVPEAKQLYRNAKEALDFVRKDGSLGVHHPELVDKLMKSSIEQLQQSLQLLTKKIQG